MQSLLNRIEMHFITKKHISFYEDESNYPDTIRLTYILNFSYFLNSFLIEPLREDSGCSIFAIEIICVRKRHLRHFFRCRTSF